MTTTRSGRLSLVFQEILTAIVRIRAGREKVPSLEHFRQQMRGALAGAQEEAVRRGYVRADAFLAAQAVVAFLDETVLNSPNRSLHEWVRQPLGPEYFEQHVAGEEFFKNIRNLLTGDDAPKTADTLELYQLCLLLGYRGRFGDSREGDIRAIVDRIAEKVQRIYGPRHLLSPEWRSSAEAVPRQANPWGRRLTWIATGAAGLFVILFLIYWLVLRGDISSLGGLA